MSDKKRVFWTETEKDAIAGRMHEIRMQQPELDNLSAARLAQEVLPQERRREFAAWSVVKPALEERLSALAQTPAVSSAKPAKPPTTGVEPDSEGSIKTDPVKHDEQGPEPRRLATGMEVYLDPLMVEAAFVTALQSPAVERAMSDLMSRALASAFAQKDSAPAVGGNSGSDKRILLAGFDANTVKSITKLLPQHEVRVWKSTLGVPVLTSMARICQVAVLPEEGSEELAEFLREYPIEVLTHSGALERLVGRLLETLG